MAWPGPLLLKDRKGRAYLVFPKEGGVFHHHKGSVPHEALLEAGPGGVVRTHLGEELSVHRPTLEEYLLHMKRSATPTYPKDASAMVTLLDLAPGMRVLEAGTGSGGLTLFLARAVGEKGLVESYEARPHHLAQAERNVRAFWQVENVRFHLGKLEEAELEEAAYDGVALDLMEPWKVLEKAALALKPDRFLVAYLPNITQVPSSSGPPRPTLSGWKGSWRWAGGSGRSGFPWPTPGSSRWGTPPFSWPLGDGRPPDPRRLAGA